MTSDSHAGHDATKTCRRHMADLATLRVAFLAISGRRDADRRHDLVKLRRLLATSIAQLGAAAEPLFANAAVHDLLPEFRNRFSAWRSAVAMHQANWPAVCIDDDPEGYRKSAIVARDLEKGFVEWFSRVCDMIERGATKR